jgi:hypothetical protein
MNVFSVRLAQTGGHLTIERPDAFETSAFIKWIATRWVVFPLLLGLLPGIALAAGPVITSVSSISPTPTQTITITGTGFGTLSPFNGDSPYIRISDVTREWNAGSTRDPGSDLVTLDVTSWTDTQITVAGFTGDYGAPPYSVPYNWTLNSGDTVDVQIWNAQTSAGPAQFTVVVGAPATGPVITSVSSILPTPTQTITITGTGFGTLSPFNGDSPYIRISDVTREWNAGSTRDPGADLVTLDVTSWTNTQITVAGFTGDYGAPPYSVPYNWTLNDGDTVDVQIWNAQTSAGPAQFNAVVGAPAATFTTSVTPDSGSGASQVFAFEYSDTNGYTHLSLAYAGFGPTAYGDENTCRLEYVRASNQLYLKNDAGTAFLGPVTPGGVGTLSNSQCSVNVGASSVTGSGDILTLSLPLSFTPAFAGTQGIFMYADDRNGQTTAGRQQRGTWMVP